jgi:hypothetical protein
VCEVYEMILFFLMTCEDFWVNARHGSLWLCFGENTVIEGKRWSFGIASFMLTNCSDCFLTCINVDFFVYCGLLHCYCVSESYECFVLVYFEAKPTF